MLETERGQRRAGRDRELRFHEIDAEHLLGDGVLDLKPRIGLDEGESRIVRLCVAVDQEFEGAEIVVVRGSGQLLCGFNDPHAQGLAQRRTWRHLDQFLVTPLDRAFTLPQMADRAMAVADDLHFDVAGVTDQTFDIDAIAAEGGLGFGLAARIGLFQLGGVIDNAHAAPAAAGDRLDHDRAAGAE